MRCPAYKYLYICPMPKKLLILPMLLLVLVTCRKERNDVESASSDPGITLSFSEDMVLFDTIFTTVGSTTRWLKVYNNSNHAIKISSISLTGPNNANFRMNVDGDAAGFRRLSGSAGRNPSQPGHESPEDGTGASLYPPQAGRGW